MTREEALCRVKGYLTDIIPTESYSEVEEIIKALEQEFCDDAISRQAVLDINFKRIILTTAKPAETIEQKVKALPPVAPKQKGHWDHGKEISREYRGQTLVNINYLDWYCSNCHCVVEQSIKPEWSYCPNCGAKMIEPQESEEV